MSSKNGGRGKPPEPPEGHGPPEEIQQIPIQKEVIQHSQATICDREGPGLRVSFVVIEGGVPTQYVYLVGEPGKKAIQDACNGGIEPATMADIPAARE